MLYSMNRNKTLLLLFILILPATVLSAQALPSATALGGNRVSIGFGMENIAFEGLYVDTGTVIEDYLYIGVGWNLKLGTLEGESMQQSMLRAFCGLPVISQDDVVPLSFLLTGVYEKINTTSAYLDTAELIRTGTGFQAAADLYRDFALNGGFTLRMVLSGVYASGVILTESVGYTEVTPVTEPYTEYLYGLKVGILYNLEERLGLGLTATVHLDGAFGIHYGAVFTMSAP